MGISFGSRTLIVIGVALVALLGALAAVQYRWSTRVAAADAQRAREHLDSAASLFANEFNGIARQAMQFLQSDARSALRPGGRLTQVPKFIGEIYYLGAPGPGARDVRRLTAEGLFTPAALPEWLADFPCAPFILDEPAAVVAPIHDIETSEERGRGSTRVMRTFRVRAGRCFAARIDEAWLREELFPQLILRSFGETAAREYEFAVVSRARPGRVLYGAPLRADLRKPFFSLAATPSPLPNPTLGTEAILVQRVEPGARELLVEGVWQLEIARKGAPLAAAFERNRRRDLLLSLGVELLLVAAIAFLVIGARRMHRLADQKMRFVAGVSHELRTPVSAIAMLSRNQADGLVTGPAKVKQYGELIHQQSRRLNEMVEQALQYAGIHSGLRKPGKDEIDLNALIGEAVEARREEAARRGVEVEVAVAPNLPSIPGDAKLLRTAFDNLMDNALKHAAAGRWIRVAACYAEGEKEVRVSVEDRGAGIDPADQVEIFEPFCRGRAAVEAQIPGSGLGLSLVRSAAEAHRGTVTLVSAPGRGSAFTIHLPV